MSKAEYEEVPPDPGATIEAPESTRLQPGVGAGRSDRQQHRARRATRSTSRSTGRDRNRGAPWSMTVAA